MTGSQRQRPMQRQRPVCGPRPRRRAPLTIVLAVAFALGAGGCAQLAKTGAPVSDTQPTGSANGDDVRIWAQGPSPSNSEIQIVEGFIQAAASGQTAIAQEYLSPHVGWDANKVLIVANPTAVAPGPAATDTFFFTGTEVGTVDGGAYSATADTTASSSAPTSYFFHVTFIKNEGYRIDQIPTGFGRALTQDEFNATFATYGLEYLIRSAAGTSLVPVIRHLPVASGDVAVAANLTGSLFTPAPDWLAAGPAVSGIDFKSLTIDQNGTARVIVDGPGTANCLVKPGPCNQLAAELMATFSVNNLSSINSVQVSDTTNDPLGSSSVQAPSSTLANFGLTSRAPVLYYLNPTSHQVYQAAAKSAGTGPPANLGPAGSKWGQLAMSAGTGGGPIAAVVDSATQSKLYIGAPGSSTAPTMRFTGGKISSLSWDESGHLWFVDTVDGQNELFRLDAADDAPDSAQQVTVLGLPVSGSIQSVSVAPDGYRIAVVYADQSGADNLAIGVAQDLDSSWSVNLGLTTDSPALITGWYAITQVTWYNGLKLAVLGEPQQTSSPDIDELYADGWAATDPANDNQSTVAPLSGAVTTGIAWAQGGSLLAYSAQQILQFNGADSQWNVWGPATSASYAR
jgi:hypothetical protein